MFRLTATATLLLSSLAFAAVGQAQMCDTCMRGMPRDSASRAAMRSHMQEQLFAGITLTDAQKKQIDGINAKYDPKMQALHPRENPDDRKTARDLMQQRMSDIRGTLTPDQQTVFDKNVAAMRQQMRGRGGPPNS